MSKKAAKAKADRGIGDLPAKAVSAKKASGVRGGTKRGGTKHQDPYFSMTMEGAFIT